MHNSMLPDLQHRLLIVAAIAVGLVPWWLMASPLGGLHGNHAPTILFAAHEPPAVIAMLIVILLPALFASLVVATLTGPLAGAFSFTASLTLALTAEGDMQAWLSIAALPSAFTTLAYEAIIWAVILLTVICLLYVASARMRRVLSRDSSQSMTLIGLHWHSLLALATTVVVGAVGTELLAASASNKQIITSLVIAFTVAGLMAGLMFPKAGALPALIAPMLLAIGAYLYVAGAFMNEAQILAAIYGRRVPGIALALPAFYASAGTLGCTLGLGVAQVAHGPFHSERMPAQRPAAGTVNN